MYATYVRLVNDIHNMHVCISIKSSYLATSSLLYRYTHVHSTSRMHNMHNTSYMMCSLRTSRTLVRTGGYSRLPRRGEESPLDRNEYGTESFITVIPIIIDVNAFQFSMSCSLVTL